MCDVMWCVCVSLQDGGYSVEMPRPKYMDMVHTDGCCTPNYPTVIKGVIALMHVLYCYSVKIIRLFFYKGS